MVSTQSKLRQLFAAETLSLIQSEVQQLSEVDSLRSNDGLTGYTWNRVLSFQFSTITNHVIEAAPLLWSVLTTAAIGNEKRGDRIRETMQKSENKSGRGSNNGRDPWLVSKTCMFNSSPVADCFFSLTRRAAYLSLSIFYITIIVIAISFSRFSGRCFLIVAPIDQSTVVLVDLVCA